MARKVKAELGHEVVGVKRAAELLDLGSETSFDANSSAEGEGLVNGLEGLW